MRFVGGCGVWRPVSWDVTVRVMLIFLLGQLFKRISLFLQDNFMQYFVNALPPTCKTHAISNHRIIARTVHYLLSQ